MGFTCSVVIAHVCMPKCNKTGYAELAPEHRRLHALLQLPQDSDEPEIISLRRPLILLIFEDQATITCGCPDELVTDFYHKLRRILAAAIITTAWKQSPTPGWVAKEEMPFIGHIIDLADKTIRPSTAKWAKCAEATTRVTARSDFWHDRWRTITRHLGWYAKIRWGLFATFDGVYRGMGDIDRQVEPALQPKLRINFQLTVNIISKLVYIVAVLRLALVCVHDDM